MMFARLTIIQGKPEMVSKAEETVQSAVIPAAQRIPGFKGGYWLIDRETGKAATVTFFSSREELEESEAEADRIRTEAMKKIGATVISVEEYEVLAQA